MYEIDKREKRMEQEPATHITIKLEMLVISFICLYILRCCCCWSIRWVVGIFVYKNSMNFSRYTIYSFSKCVCVWAWMCAKCISPAVSWQYWGQWATDCKWEKWFQTALLDDEFKDVIFRLETVVLSNECGMIIFDMIILRIYPLK